VYAPLPAEKKRKSVSGKEEAFWSNVGLSRLLQNEKKQARHSCRTYSPKSYALSGFYCSFGRLLVEESPSF